MEAELIKVVLSMPGNCVGEVCGNLNSRRAWLDNLKNEDGVLIVETRIPIAEFADFKEWFKRFTNGKGKVENV
jgi:translation elongation factor EF-G